MTAVPSIYKEVHSEIYQPVVLNDKKLIYYIDKKSLTALISLLNSIHRIVFSCIPITDSWFELMSKDFNFPSRHPDQTWIGSWKAQHKTGLWWKSKICIKYRKHSNFWHITYCTKDNLLKNICCFLTWIFWFVRLNSRFLYHYTLKKFVS